MALLPGNNHRVISRNIAYLERAGFPHTQAVGIARRFARKKCSVVESTEHRSSHAKTLLVSEPLAQLEN